MVGPGERVRLKVFSLKVSRRGRVWISQRGYATILTSVRDQQAKVNQPAIQPFFPDRPSCNNETSYLTVLCKAMNIFMK